jgi:hypothetical protein
MITLTPCTTYRAPAYSPPKLLQLLWNLPSRSRRAPHIFTTTTQLLYGEYSMIVNGFLELTHRSGEDGRVTTKRFIRRWQHAEILAVRSDVW